MQRILSYDSTVEAEMEETPDLNYNLKYELEGYCILLYGNDPPAPKPIEPL